MSDAAQGGEQEWTDEAHRLVRFRFWSHNVSSQTPFDDDQLRQLESDARPDSAPDPFPYTDVVDLREVDAWLRLHSRFTAGIDANFSPWNRCLSVLYDLGAVACVIERYYVCLDYKSEIVSFYSHLDRARSLTATRLHFFREPIAKEDDLHNLREEQRTSYLGYIVTRPGNMPLVGRTVIAAPSYITVCASIMETVHFFGQTLTVRGVPFMQQDTQFAVCSQVAVWAIHYSAFRSGLVQRRLVAEIVALSSAIEPMKPHVSDGLRVDEVAHLLRAAGLTGKTYETFDLANVDLPRIHLNSIPEAASTVEQIRSTLGEGINELTQPEDDVAQFAVDYGRLVSDEPFGGEASMLAVTLFDMIFSHMLEVFLRSNRPVYAGTTNHAMIVCGTARRDDGTTFFVHDDQFGPYLALNSLIAGSRTALQHQAYNSVAFPAIVNELDFPSDRTRAITEGDAYRGDDFSRAILAVVIAQPNRLVLQPSEAEFDCLELLTAAWNTAGVNEAWLPRSTLLMGIDYKAQRRASLIAAGDINGARLFASTHLAEWVVVVEDGSASASGTSSWELVYDGSSGPSGPIVQLARFGSVVTASQPLDASADSVALQSSKMPWIFVPDRIGKA